MLHVLRTQRMYLGMYYERRGCIVRLCEDFKLDDAFTQAGADVQLVAQLPYKNRIGAKAFPWPGFACLVTNVHGDREIQLICLKLDIVLKQGVALTDINAFLESPYGSDQVSKAPLLTLEAHTWAVIPFGYFVLPIFVPTGEPASALVADVANCAMFLHCPIFSVEAAVAVGAQAFNAAVTCNNDFFNVTAGNKQLVEYAARKALHVKFQEAVKL